VSPGRRSGDAAYIAWACCHAGWDGLGWDGMCIAVGAVRRGVEDRDRNRDSEIETGWERG
jgi:hypothetical protein